MPGPMWCFTGRQGWSVLNGLSDGQVWLLDQGQAYPQLATRGVVESSGS